MIMVAMVAVIMMGDDMVAMMAVNVSYADVMVVTMAVMMMGDYGWAGLRRDRNLSPVSRAKRSS